MKKCPPGVICVENITLCLLFIIMFVLGFFIYSNTKQNIIVNDRNNITIHDKKESSGSSIFTRFLPSWPYNNDVLLNPYSPPLRDERYFIPEMTYMPPGSVPINVSTNIGAVDTTYRQVGIMTPLNGVEKNNILPLMGRVLFNRRDLWNYYTISNQHNNVKLPILVKGKSALTDIGVDKIYNGDSVYVQGENDAYKVTIYDNDTIRYLPFI